MNCPHCSTPLNPADISGKYCWCTRCRVYVPATLSAESWLKKLKVIHADPTQAMPADIERMAAECLQNRTAQNAEVNHG